MIVFKSGTLVMETVLKCGLSHILLRNHGQYLTTLRTNKFFDQPWPSPTQISNKYLEMIIQCLKPKLFNEKD